MIEYIAWFILIGGLIANVLLVAYMIFDYRRMKRERAVWEQRIHNNWQQFLDAAEEEVNKCNE